MYERTEKYVRQTLSVREQPSIERIIQDKGEQNGGRYRDLTQKARSLVAEARLFVRGEEIEVRAEDPQARIGSAFQTLVDKVYPNLGMLRGIVYTEDDIGKHLAKGKDSVFGAAGTGLTEAEQEILNFAQANARKGVRTTAQAIVDGFEKKSYGWPYAAILCTTASLIARGKIEARMDGSPLEGDALERSLRSNREQIRSSSNCRSSSHPPRCASSRNPTGSCSTPSRRRLTGRLWGLRRRKRSAG